MLKQYKSSKKRNLPDRYFNPLHPHCGPGNSIAKTVPSNPVDAACWRHDIAYGQFARGDDLWNQVTNPAYRVYNQADERFVVELRDLIRSGELSYSDKLAAEYYLQWFQLKKGSARNGILKVLRSEREVIDPGPLKGLITNEPDPIQGKRRKMNDDTHVDNMEPSSFSGQVATDDDFHSMAPSFIEFYREMQEIAIDDDMQYVDYQFYQFYLKTLARSMYVDSLTSCAIFFKNGRSRVPGLIQKK